MRRTLLHVGGLLLATGLLLTAATAPALIVRLTPMKSVLAESQFVCLARVEKVEPERPLAVLVIEEDLKGKAPARRLPVNLAGDEEGKKLKHPEAILKRLAPKLPVIVFGFEGGPGYAAFGYTNGTWFQLVAEKPREGEAPVWRFTHCEPYLRRTFKGTTAEMRQVILDGLAGKPLPAVNPKEPPGLGPEVEGQGTTRSASGPRASAQPLFAVIPTIGVGGPLAILALLFPSLFGGVILLFRQWLAFFTVVSVNSLVCCLHYGFADELVGSWWGTPVALWAVMTVVTLLGTLWAGWRHARSLTGRTPLPEAPPRTELIVLGLLALSCLVIVVVFLFTPPSLFEPWWGLLLAFTAGLWIAGFYRSLQLLTAEPPAPAAAGGVAAPAREPRAPRAALSTESVILWMALFVSTALALARPGGGAAPAADPNAAGEGRASAQFQKDKLWTKVFADGGGGYAFAAPVLDGDRAYVAIAHGLAFPFGRVYCVDLNTGNILWQFDDNKAMKQVFCTPTLAGGRLYVGEGFHHDQNCKMYCLEAKSGRKLWEFATQSHTEGRPVVSGGRVYFSGGDDGLYCVEADTGKKVWQYPDDERRKTLHLHVDSSPAVVDGKVYVGGGIDDETGHGDCAIACLDAATGKEIWIRPTPKLMVQRGDAGRTPLPLPAWGAPVVENGQVFFGLGNGRITESSGRFEPAGALLAVDARTGQDLWPPFQVGDGVIYRVALDRARVYFGSRDGHCYCVDRETGKLRWKVDVGSPVVATPALDTCRDCGQTATVFVLGTGGQVLCLDAYTGKVHWSFAELMASAPTLASPPQVVVTHTPQGDRRQIFFGATLNNNSIPALYRLEDLLPAR